jgi:hypothetical protein
MDSAGERLRRESLLLRLNGWLDDRSEELAPVDGNADPPRDGTSRRVRLVDAGDAATEGIGEDAGTSGAETGPDGGNPSQMPWMP